MACAASWRVRWLAGLANGNCAAYRQAVRTLSCLALFLVASCGSDSPALLEPEAIAGTYELVSIDGEPLPVSGPDALYDYEVLSASLVIALDGMVHETLTRSERLGLYPAEVRTYTSSHPYRLGADRIVIEYGEAEATARVRGEEITVSRGSGAQPRSAWAYVRSP